MIFVTVGSLYGFERLIIKMDHIAKILDEEVILQIGKTNYEPQNASFFRFKSRKEIANYYDNANLIICHAGIGTIIAALERNKKIIVVPRYKKYGEAYDDHQLQISCVLEREGMAKVVYEIDELYDAIKMINVHHPNTLTSSNTLGKNLAKYLKKFDC